MNVRTILLWGIIAVLTLLVSCQNPTGPDTQVTSIPTSVRGLVMRSDNLTPVTNAIVYDVGGLARDTSRSDGTFRLVYQLLSQTKTRIIGSRSGYGNDTSVVTLNPGVDTTIVLRLKADSSSPSGAVSTGKAANIVLVASSSDNISIRGTGSNETAVLQFEVRDSLGIPIAGVNKLTVNFSILGGPGGGEYVFPVTSETDPLTGRVTTRISSGTKAGVLQLLATATVPGTPPLTIKSSPIKITISGGLPDDSHFSISRKPLNIAGGVYDNLRAQIQVIVGDKEGNPVQQGTAVSFTTTGGVIQPNAVTDRDGIAQVDLISANPRPSNSVAIVTAKTIGDSGKVIQKSTVVLFSGATRILTPSSTVVVPDSGVASFEYRVQDPNGFPLAGSTSVTLTVDGPGSGDLELSGDVTKTLEDTNDPNSTLFKATVRDKKLRGPGGAVTFKISVVSQNGNVSATFPGFVLSDTSVIVAPSKSGYISSLTLAGIDNTQLSVSGTGANETAKLTFAAKDSVGNPIELRKRAYVTFSLSPTGGVGGGEFLFPAADSTDAFGQVTTTFNAGSRAGVLQVIARSTYAGRTITTSPIRVTIAGGLPDSNRFTATLSSVNMPGLIKAGALGTVGVQVGDKFGNAVQPGTALAFSISGGLIQANTTTDAAGQASAVVYGGNPAPNEPTLGGVGHGFITVQTVGEGGIAIRKKIPFLFSGQSRIVPPSALISIPDSGVATFQYRVQDVNGNPLVAGTTVNLTVDGPGAGNLALSGDVAKTLLDLDDPVSTLLTATVQDKVLKGSSGAVTFKVTVASPNGNAVTTFPGIVLQDTSTVPPVVVGGGKARYAASLTLVGGSLPGTLGPISVKGTGSTEAVRITFVAKDSVGNAIDASKRAYVKFKIMPLGGTGGGEYLSPVADSTDAAGQVSTTLNAGIKPGVVQIVATTRGDTVISSPVTITISQGLADQAHFTMAIATGTEGSVQVMPQDTISLVTWPKAGANVAQIIVQVGDRYGNPVQPGTALYFGTSAGLIFPRAVTNENGWASTVWQGGNPAPKNDTASIWVETVGNGGIAVGQRNIVRLTQSIGSYSSGFASSLTLKSNVTNQLSVRGTGAIEATTLTFVARDSVGNLLDPKRRLLVNFSISPTNGLGGGEFLSPISGYTDGSGEVTTTFNSGVRSGVVQIVATATVSGQTITVASGRITISGGFPDPTKLTAFLSRVNMPGIAKTGPIGTMSVQVGDKFGNPVQAGTAVSFSSNGGLIQPFAQTDANGLATVTLQGGKPFPNDPTAGGPGYGTITLQTVGEAGAAISVPIQFLFSGAPIVTLQNVPNDTLKIFDASSYDVDFTVADANGNPVSSGHNITVNVSGQAAASIGLVGDVNLFTPDTKDKANFTHYRFRVTDLNPNGGISGEVVFTVTVNGEAGSFVKKFYGNLQPPQVANTVPPTARQPSQIAFLGISNTDIYVAGVGNTENSVITYEVRDSLGIPIDRTRRVFATFSLQFYPNNNVGGGLPPQIIPSADSTDDSGKLRTAIVSGTQAGVVQVVAKLQLPGGGQVASQPVRVSVHAGFADQAHFTITPGHWVFPGFDPVIQFPFFNQVQFTTVVADTFSNPVQVNTAVYYNTQAGVMQTGTTGPSASYTNNTGISTSWLYAVNPKPAAPPFCDLSSGSGRPGYHWVYAQTQGRGGKWIIDSVLVVQNRAPIVITGVPAATIQVPRGLVSAPISMTFKDANGNPLPDGTTITATVLFTSDVPGIKFEVGGDLSSTRGFVMPNASYARFPGARITDFTFFVGDLSTNGGATIGQSMIIQIEIQSANLDSRIVSFPAVIVP
ncbi:MAG: Ig-like domain-containing protein [Ignavibacteriales bacterium]|nr:Ig-like domain-containing protein [Ignavibacteriales bacterium]